MESRSIAIGLIAIVAAFAAAFGLAKSGASKTPAAGAGVKAESIKVAAPPAVAGVTVGGTLPSLKTVHKATAKKKAKTPSSSSNTSSASTNNSSTTQSNSSTNSTTQPTQVQKQVQPVQRQTQTVQKKKAPVNQAPVRSNVENG